jgi:hypothetical protein
MKPAFECGVTASFLRSGRALANASNCAAVVAAVGILLAHATTARLIFIAPLFCWPFACYFSVRVAIDRSLFTEMTLAPDDSGPALDEFLRGRGLLRNQPKRTIADRSRGALKLWNRLIAITAIQIASLLAGMIVEALAR